MGQLKTFFYSFTRSLFEPKYYKDVAKVKFWFSFRYLWFLIFLLTIIKVFTIGGKYIKNRPQIQPEVNKFVSYAENFYPRYLKLQIKNGQLSTNVVEPYIFDIEKDKWRDQKHFIIIDTKGSIENYPNYNTNILATRNAIVYPSESKNNKMGETSVFYFRELKKDFTVDKKAYDNLLNIVKPYTPRVSFFIDWIVLSFSPLFMIFGSLFWTGGVMFGLLFLTFFVWIINLIFKKQYSYGSLFKMGMHAVTWPILITEIAKYLAFSSSALYALIFIFWMLIILFSTEKEPDFLV
ncbi:conserved membrane hypothetical protein [Candidatus Roizmanbacteria bacterium]|nr:conserved membrane hypothetical protein [Candidatus Roizmanbacteria bacterium]